LPCCRTSLVGAEQLPLALRALQLVFAKRGRPVDGSVVASFGPLDADPVILQCVSARKLPFEAEFLTYKVADGAAPPEDLRRGCG